MFKLAFITALISLFFITKKSEKTPNSWIRINQLGYTPHGTKLAVWCSKENQSIQYFQLIDSATGKTVFQQKAGKGFGSYGPFEQTYRFNFSSFNKPGKYYLHFYGTRRKLIRRICTERSEENLLSRL